MFGNELEGSIPESLGDLIGLEELGLSENKLMGPLPESLSRLTRLVEIDLSDNELSGPIPFSYLALTKLEVLLLARNQLFGPLTHEFVSTWQEIDVDLSGNDFLYLDGVKAPERWEMEGCGLKRPPAKRPF